MGYMIDVNYMLLLSYDGCDGCEFYAIALINVGYMMDVNYP